MTVCENYKTLATARGYTGELDHQEKMSKSHTQHKCDKCGLWHIWKKAKNSEVKG